MRNLDDFTRGYIECALWSETDNSTESGGYPLDKNYGIDDLAPETLEQMIKDCEEFQRENCATLSMWYTFGQHEENAGHDFWFTRNGHGTGFWDRFYNCPQAKVGEKLSNDSEAYGDCSLYVDDGKIYIM